MKLILLDDVERLGHEGEVVTVADGYGNNYLLPRGLAEKCTKAGLQALEQRRRAIQRREQEKGEAAQELAERIREAGVTVTAAVGEGGRLHGQVTTQQIAEAIAERIGTRIDRRDIDIPVPIREVGNYLITATLYKEVRCEIPVYVVPSEAEQQPVVEEEEQAEPPQAPEVAEQAAPPDQPEAD